MCPKTQDERNEMFLVPYSNVVGSLMYVMMCTCTNICFVVRLVSRYQSNPKKILEDYQEDIKISKKQFR